MRGIGPAVVGAVVLTVAQLTPHAASDAFTGTLLVLTVAALLLWRVPPIPATLAGGLLGILARSRALRDFT
jgi:chromate transporter